MQNKEWADELKRELDRENYPQWPNETMLKVLFGNYLKKKFILPKNANVLDVGCFFGNNLFQLSAILSLYWDNNVDLYAPDVDIICKKENIDKKDTIYRNIKTKKIKTTTWL